MPNKACHPCAAAIAVPCEGINSGHPDGIMVGGGGGGGEDDHRGWFAGRKTSSLFLNGVAEPSLGLATSRGPPEDERDDSIISSSSRSLASFRSARDVSVACSASSSFSSSSPLDFDEDFDVGVNGSRHRVVHCEVEEIPSFRWLPSPLRWLPSPEWGKAHGRRRRPSHAPIDGGLLLPSDYDEILSRAVSPLEYSSMEQLCQRLCEPVLIDNGLKMMWLDKPTGKKCFMLSARAITIIWGDDARYWRWISAPDARFPEVAELVAVCWLEIRASISSEELSPGTRYGAYLVMRLSDSSFGLGEPPQETEISVRGHHSSKRSVRLQEVQPACWSEVHSIPRERRDEWMELEMGDFFVEGRRKRLVDVRLKGWQRLHWKSGLIVHGIEVRPTPTA